MKRIPFSFRLYVARDAENSIQAVHNLTAICQKHLPGRHRIEVVDVFTHPKRALADGIFLTPTLIRVTPSPVKRIVFPDLEDAHDELAKPRMRTAALGLLSPSRQQVHRFGRRRGQPDSG